MDENKVYPVLYYDIANADTEKIILLIDQLEEFFRKDKIPFILLPKDMNLKYLTKEEALQEIKNIEEYVKTWE